MYFNIIFFLCIVFSTAARQDDILDFTLYTTTSSLPIFSLSGKSISVKVGNPPEFSSVSSETWIGTYISEREFKACRQTYNTAKNLRCKTSEGGSSYEFIDNQSKTVLSRGIYGYSQAIINGHVYETRAAILIVYEMMNLPYSSPASRSLTVSLGDTFTLDVSEPTDCFHLCPTIDENSVLWRHNGTELTTAGLSLEIRNARVEHSGIYDADLKAVNVPLSLPTFFEVTVRGCPASKYGLPECLGECPVCYNGGICDHVTGLCICANGFIGVNCENVCESRNQFGRHCNMICSNDDCSGYYICPSDPIECDCGAGWHNIKCESKCTDGKYGPSCRQTCNCESRYCDSKFGCTGGQCYNGYTGDRCLVRTAETCPDGYFGENCHKKCRCRQSMTCARETGSCGEPCPDGWTGIDCHIALPSFYNTTLSVSNVAQVQVYPLLYSVTLQWAPWKFGHDYGNVREPATYGIVYSEVGTESVTIVNTTEYSIALFLDMSVKYDVHIVVYRTVENITIAGVPTASVQTEIVCPTELEVPDLTVNEVRDKLLVNWVHVAACNVQYEVTYTLLKEDSSEVANTTTLTTNKNILIIMDVLPIRNYKISVRAISNGNQGPEKYIEVSTKERIDLKVAYAYMVTPFFIILAMVKISYRFQG